MRLNISKSDAMWQISSLLSVLILNTLFLYITYTIARNDMKQQYIRNVNTIINICKGNEVNDKNINDINIVEDGIYNFKIECSKCVFNVDNKLLVHNFIKLYVLGTVLIILLYIIIVTVNLIRRRKRIHIEETIANSYMESKLYKTMSTVVTHEMSLPITVSKICMRNMKESLHKYLKEDGVECKSEKDFTEAIECLELNLNSVESVISRFDLDKNIRSGHNNASILYIIEAGIASVNMGIAKIDSKIHNKELLDSYKLANNISSGAMLNIIINHTTNSKDAKASIVEFRGKIKNGMLELLIIDNGRGVRDLDDKIVKNLDIFNNGYSTKDKYGNPLKLTMRDKLFHRLGLPIGKTRSSERGIGLSMNTAILKEGNGDITLVSTSETHTIFKLMIPVEKS